MKHRIRKIDDLVIWECWFIGDIINIPSGWDYLFTEIEIVVPDLTLAKLLSHKEGRE